MLFERIFKALNQQRVKYVVIGGVAVNLHGFSRFTGDLDIALSLTDVEIAKFVKVTKKLGLVPRLPVKIEDFADPAKRTDWIEHKNMKVFSVYNPRNPMEHIDVMIHHVIDFDKMHKNRVTMKEGTLRIPVVGIPDLIRLKETAGRDRDAIDINVLRKIQRAKL
ncbi:MAG: hypothetical protein HYU99_07095 [Deltaproteobacteria bacterium]|nr:hypothetical protein [Deltaproteobacteria bacterium]